MGLSDPVYDAMRTNTQQHQIPLRHLEEDPVAHTHTEFPQTLHSPDLMNPQRWMTRIAQQEAQLLIYALLDMGGQFLVIAPETIRATDFHATDQPFRSANSDSMSSKSSNRPSARSVLASR